MIASPEDAELLLKKWSSESAEILAFISSADRSFVSRLVGRIEAIYSKLVCCFRAGDNFILFRLRDCKIGYGEDVEVLSTYEQVLKNDREQWKAALVLTYIGGAVIVLCTKE